MSQYSTYIDIGFSFAATDLVFIRSLSLTKLKTKLLQIQEQEFSEARFRLLTIEFCAELSNYYNMQKNWFSSHFDYDIENNTTWETQLKPSFDFIEQNIVKIPADVYFLKEKDLNDIFILIIEYLSYRYESLRVELEILAEYLEMISGSNVIIDGNTVRKTGTSEVSIKKDDIFFTEDFKYIHDHQKCTELFASSMKKYYCHLLIIIFLIEKISKAVSYIIPFTNRKSG